MKKIFALLLIVFAFVFTLFTVGTADAFEVERATVGLSTGAERMDTLGSDDFYKDLTLFAKLDAELTDEVPLLGTLGLDLTLSYSGVNLNELHEFTGRRVDPSIGFYSAPCDWARVTSIFSEDIKGTWRMDTLAEVGWFY